MKKINKFAYLLIILGLFLANYAFADIIGFVIFGIDASNPPSQTNSVNICGNNEFNLLVFDANTSSNFLLNSFVLNHVDTGTHPIAYSLYANSVKLQSQPWSNGPVTFNNINSLIPVPGTPGSIYTIKAEMPGSVLGGSSEVININSLTYKNFSGQVFNNPVTLFGNIQSFSGLTRKGSSPACLIL